MYSAIRIAALSQLLSVTCTVVVATPPTVNTEEGERGGAGFCVPGMW